jgi:phosphomevalonate kinase
LADNDYYSSPPVAAAEAAAPSAAKPSSNPSTATAASAAAPSPSSSSSSATPPASSINAASASRAAAGSHAVPTSVSGRRYARFPTTLAKAHKTGLGSSAALVTALTAALLTHYLPATLFDLSSDAGRTTLHNLAQAAHCAAQGKVGSGFDVAAAVYGSCRYRRFSPGILSSLPDAGSPGFATALERCVAGGRQEPPDDDDGAAQRWDTEVAKDGVRLPAGVAVRMCDVDCGSQTVGMVKGVLAWRGRDAAAAKALWDELQERNDRLAAVLRDGNTADIRAATRAVRELVRKMGAESDVPIEPESQTALLDALEGVEGVFGGVVPGAGGYDALALLVRDDDETARRIEAFVEEWGKTKAGKVRLLGVKGEMDGVRAENVAEYQEWI